MVTAQLRGDNGGNPSDSFLPLDILKHLADLIETSITKPSPSVLMRKIHENESAHTVALAVDLQKYIECRRTFEDIGYVSRREVTVRALKNVGLGEVARDVDSGIDQIYRELRDFEGKWKATIKHNGEIIKSRRLAGDRYVGAAADYLRSDDGNPIYEATDSMAEIVSDCESFVSMIRQFLIDRRRLRAQQVARSGGSGRPRKPRRAKNEKRDSKFVELDAAGKTADEIAALWNKDNYDNVGAEAVRQALSRWKKKHKTL